MQKRTEIIIETERLVVVSQRRRQPVLWCSGCERNVPMLTVYEAARFAAAAPSVIANLAEAGRIHSVLTLEGRLFICPNSLSSGRGKAAEEGLTPLNF